jgi:hypothetical protein
MVALATVLVVIIVSLLIARVATVALVLTGLSHEAARFQARSALSGTGFTTGEAESVVGHPVRRRVVMLLMLVGSAGLVTVIATLMLSFTDTGGGQKALRLGLLVAGVTALWVVARSAWVDRRLSWLIARFLRRWKLRGPEADFEDVPQKGRQRDKADGVTRRPGTTTQTSQRSRPGTSALPTQTRSSRCGTADSCSVLRSRTSAIPNG